MFGEKQKTRILLIGDGKEDSRLVSKACQSVGHEMQQALNGRIALMGLQACENGIKLVILDIDMPGGGGIETLKIIRSNHPGLPVIVLTAFSERQVECEFLGIETFIHKPYSPESFICRILFVLDPNNGKKKKPEAVSAGNPFAKVLIANEKKEICELLCVVLTEDVLNAHFDVAWACSGEEALQVSREFKPDIGILDIRVSDMWGHELIDHFKTGKGHAPKDFIIYSSFVEPRQMEPILKLGYPVFLDLMQLEVLVECLKKMCIQHNFVRMA